MNFLAHAVLAGDDAAYRVGGLIGDFVKGPLPAGLPAELAAGVALHRAIDAYAERHPAFNASRARVGGTRRRLAGILVDMFYDHLLARDWAQYASPEVATPLDAYAQSLYAELRRYAAQLPEAARTASARMAAGDWLGSYGDVQAVAQAIDRMALYRLRRPNALAGGIEEFFADADGYADDFRVFFADARDYAALWRARQASAAT